MGLSELFRPCPRCEAMNRPKTGDVIDAWTIMYSYHCFKCYTFYFFHHVMEKGLSFERANNLPRGHGFKRVKAKVPKGSS